MQGNDYTQQQEAHLILRGSHNQASEQCRLCYLELLEQRLADLENEYLALHQENAQLRNTLTHYGLENAVPLLTQSMAEYYDTNISTPGPTALAHTAKDLTAQYVTLSLFLYVLTYSWLHSNPSLDVGAEVDDFYLCLDPRLFRDEVQPNNVLP